VLTSLFGILNEFYQIFIPGRTLNILDVIANMVGSLIVVLLIQFFLIKTKTQKEY
jgi:VanZ family protein